MPRNLMKINNLEDLRKGICWGKMEKNRIETVVPINLCVEK
jgi:hypothetical protein